MDKKDDGHTPERDLIIGRNAVQEALRAGRLLDTVYIKRSSGGGKGGSMSAILAKAKQQDLVIKEVDSKKLDRMCGGANHQGIAAVAALKAYAQLDDLFALAENRGEPPFFIILDEISDPYNLGAILRTAECAGAHGVIVPKRHSAPLSYAVGKASAGAVEYVPVARVVNLTNTIEMLKKRGVWIYAADMEGSLFCAVDYRGPLALVIGSEGAGISRLVKDHADFVISLPMHGKIRSLNASVAAGVICYEVAKQRSSD